MMKCSIRWAVLGVAFFAASSWAATLADLEQWAIESADSLALADLDSEIAKQRLQIVSGELGPKWIAGASTGQYQEPQSDTAVRNYSGLNASAGVRIPVLGSARAAQRGVEDAQKLVRISALQRDIKLGRLLQEVRLAYNGYVHSMEKMALAKAWLSLEPALQAPLLARTREHALLETDRLALQSGFYVARRDLDRYTLAADSARAALHRLSKHPAEPIQVTTPQWSTACFSREALRSDLEKRPSAAIKAVELEARQQQTRNARWRGAEANVTLQQSIVRNFGGQDGQATVLGFDFSMPIDMDGVQRARDREDELRVLQARRDLEMTIAEEVDALENVLSRVQASSTDLSRAKQRLNVSLEGNRIAALRAKDMAGDVLEKAVMARYELYLSAIDAVETAERAHAAHIDALSYGPACPSQDKGGELQATLVALLSEPVVTQADSPSSKRLGLTWFLWRGDALMGQEPAPVPSEPGRLLVSFNREQVAALQNTVTADVLLRHLDRLHSLGWKVDLLLGDALFVTPQGRKDLLNLIGAMAQFPFDGVNLDLERSDLPKKYQSQWWPLTLQTLQSAQQIARKPVTLTTHYREFDREAMGAELQRVGVGSAMAMIYVTDSTRVSDIARRILLRHPTLRVAFVQSVEAQLPTTESAFEEGRSASLQRWKNLGENLRLLPNFAGVAVQSLENFNAMKP